MSDNTKKTELSAIAFKYLQMINENDEKVEIEEEKIEFMDISVNNSKVSEKQTESFMKSFPNIMDATDLLIQENDLFQRSETSQLSFMYNQEAENENLQLSGALNSINVFEDNSLSSVLSPPNKRYRYERQDSFFNSPNSEQPFSMMDSFFRPDAANCTEDIFNVNFQKTSSNQSISFFNTFSEINKPVPRVQFELSQSLAASEMSEIKSFLGSQEETTFTTEKIDENAVEANIKNNFDKNEARILPVKVNTYYEAPYFEDKEKFEEYYKKNKFDDWESIENNLDSLMEPSLDYVAYRLKCMKPITTGSKEQIINRDELDAFDCSSFNETLQEIHESFDNGKFICSTPEELDISEENAGTNPLDIGYLNFMTDPSNNSNPVSQPDQNEDADKTRSFLVDKESQDVWSALTHVSCSVPINDEPENGQLFDITTIFDYDYRGECAEEQNFDHSVISQDKCLDNDMFRYEMMLSILNSGDNTLEKTTADLDETLRIVQNRKAAIMSHVEMIIQGLVTSLIKQEPMILKFHKVKDWKECKFEGNILSQKETAIRIKSLSFTNKNTKRTFTVMVHLLGEIFKLLANNTSCTKRELYYRDVELMKSQASVNKAMDEICALLNVQCWELGVLSTSKGLIAGDLRITTEDDEIIDYSITNSVPQKPSGIKYMESNAEYILVVEKDTVFTRLIEDQIMEKIGTKIILVTSKGYPDINTRLLLKKFETELQKPIYIIVDADPYGIDIMCTYKFGSLQMVNFSEQLAITKMEWIGIHPTDIEKLDITRTELTDADKKKVDELIARPYMNKHLENELKNLKSRGLKAEIESIYHFSIDYLIYDYIPQKIAAISNPIQQIIQDTDCFKEQLF